MRAATATRRRTRRSIWNSSMRGPTSRSTSGLSSGGSGRSPAASVRWKCPGPAPASEILSGGSVRRSLRSCLPVPLSSACTTAGTGPESESESPRSSTSIGNEIIIRLGRSV